MISAEKKLEAATGFDAVVAAAIVPFGFVFIHPFVDGNGRIHRYLIYHVHARKGYVPKGIIFPVSAIILVGRIPQSIRSLLFAPGLNLIEWKATDNNNVEVLNIDLYHYSDATKQAEFL